MASVVFSLVRQPMLPFPVFKSKFWWLCLVLAGIILLSMSSVLVYASGYGGWVSEKLVGRSGVADSNLLIERSGVSNSGLDVAMSGVVTSVAVDDMYIDAGGVANAVLRANLTTLNGFPSATVYFQWGYDTNYGSASSSQVVTGVGEFTSTIQGYDPSRMVYYRAVVETDGTNYSSGNVFQVGTTGVVGGFNLLNAVVVVAYIAMIVFVTIVLGSRSTIVALLFIAIAIYLGEAFVTGIQEALRNIF